MAGATITLNVDQLPDDLRASRCGSYAPISVQTHKLSSPKTMGCKNPDNRTLGTGECEVPGTALTIVKGAVGFAASDGSRIFRLICSYGVG